MVVEPAVPHLQAVGRVVGRSGTAFVLAVLGDEEGASERVVVWREANPERIAVAVGDRPNRMLEIAQLGGENRARAHSDLGRAGEGVDHLAGRPGDAVRQVAASIVTVARVEVVAAEHYVLTRNFVLEHHVDVGRTADAAGPGVVVADNAGIRDGAL